MEQLKIFFLLISKWIGLFHLSNYLYRHKLNILCYHGFSYHDEHKFRPSLFVTPQTFEKRLNFIKKKKFQVLTLSDGLNKLYKNSLPKNSIVITIDDGFRSVIELAVPLLQKYEQSATVYVTTYYAIKGVPIFRLLVQYMVWKSDFDEQEATTILAKLFGVESSSEDIMDIIKIAETDFNESKRVAVSKLFAEKLGLNYNQLASSGVMSLMDESELRKISSLGIDIQLHTHRHCLPLEPDSISTEIEGNRTILEPIAGKKLNHLCYPSGIWDERQWSALEKLNVSSATTCNPGMNDSSTQALALNRFLDREDIPQIEFEAELFGYKELLRDIKSFLRGGRS